MARDHLGQIATLAMLHHQIDRSVLLVYEFVEASHYIVCLDLAQDLDLVVELLALLLAHASVVGHFPDHFAPCRYVHHLRHFSK